MNNQQAVHAFGEECPICHGTGFEVFREETEGYETPLEYARLCRRCGEKQRKGDTGIPVQFSDADLRKFQFDSYSENMDKFKKLIMNFFEKYKEWEKSGKGLYLWSQTPGSGKTFLACSIANSVSMKYSLQMRFISAPDYLAVVGESYKRQRGEEDLSRIYRYCPFLVLDDIGTQKTGEWQEQELFRLIDERLNSQRVTVLTSNLPPEKLNVSQRIIDRIMRMSIVLQMPEESIRLKKAREEQERFLKRVLA